MKLGSRKAVSTTLATIVIIIIIIGVAAAIYVESSSVSRPSPTGTSTSTSVLTSNISANSSTSSDYQFFIQPYISNENALRVDLMTPFSPGVHLVGYDATIGLIRGDYLCGGYKSDVTLQDPNLIIASTLDYLNSQHGVHTNIEEITRQYLSRTFNIALPAGYTTCSSTINGIWTYRGNDRREFLFGTSSPSLPSCVNNSDGYAFLQTEGTIFSAEIPGNCVSISATSSGKGMNIWAMYINYLWLKGDSTDRAQVTQMFQTALSAWTPTSGTGVGGTAGGYFNSKFDGGNCKSTRTLAYFIESARATGLWAMSSTSKQITQQVINELWAHQNPDGSMKVNYPGCGSTRDSGESDGLTLVAFDPRVPSWFS